MNRPPVWDLDANLFFEIREGMIERYGVIPSKKVFATLLGDIKSSGGRITKDGLTRDDQIIANWDNTVQWFIHKLCDTPDGIASIAKKKAKQPKSSLYTECFEVLRTHRKKPFTAEQIAERIHMDLSRDKRNQLRQLRRLMIKICEENNGRVRRPTKTQTTFELR